MKQNTTGKVVSLADYIPHVVDSITDHIVDEGLRGKNATVIRAKILPREAIDILRESGLRTLEDMNSGDTGISWKRSPAEGTDAVVLPFRK